MQQLRNQYQYRTTWRRERWSRCSQHGGPSSLHKGWSDPFPCISSGDITARLIDQWRGWTHGRHLKLDEHHPIFQLHAKIQRSLRQIVESFLDNAFEMTLSMFAFSTARRNCQLAVGMPPPLCDTFLLRRRRRVGRKERLHSCRSWGAEMQRYRPRWWPRL